MAADEYPYQEIMLSEFIGIVRRHHNSDESVSVQDIVTNAITDRERHFLCLQVDRAPDGDDMENSIFDALASTLLIKMLVIDPEVEASCVPELLGRVLPMMPGVNCCVGLLQVQMSQSEAKEIFEQIRHSNISELGIVFRGEDGMDAFVRCIRESSSIDALTICCHPGETISVESFHSICAAISCSLSLELLNLNDVAVNEAAKDENVAESLANAIVNSSSVSAVAIIDQTSFTVDELCHALSHKFAVRNFDLLFRKHTPFDGAEALSFSRGREWKRLVADDSIALSKWPYLLNAADNWHEEDSHSHLDFLFYLMREKNPVLLQNVRRRRIRKRKRYGFDA